MPDVHGWSHCQERQSTLTRILVSFHPLPPILLLFMQVHVSIPLLLTLWCKRLVLALAQEGVLPQSSPCLCPG